MGVNKMKKLLVVALFFIFGPNLSLAQDFNKGYKAYEAGDFSTALKEWKPLAVQGNAVAQNNIGNLYNSGKGALKDRAQALKWYRLSAKQGYSNAQFNLGNFYASVDDTYRNYNKSVKWFRLSSEQGNASAQRNLGAMYANGHGVLQDNITSHMWYNIASANGNEEAGELRNNREKKMTSAGIEKATAMARECMSSGYKKCGH